MAIRETRYPAGTPCWIDLATPDIEQTKSFYSGVLGWNFTDTGADFGGYNIIDSDGQPVAGAMQSPLGESWPNVWTIYFSTEDIHASNEAAVTAGATVIAPAMQVGPLGWMAILADPAGGAFGLWQPDQFIGYTKLAEPGAVAWNEYHSKNFTASTPFYQQLFGWKLEPLSDTDEFRYFTAVGSEGEVAGMMDSSGLLPAEVPSHWTIYINVVDVDATLEKVVEFGGAVLRPAEDTDFGRMADVADSTGAPFKLQQELSRPA